MALTPVPYRKTTCLTDYYPIPRSLLEEKLPLMALLIYGMLLDRATLSRKNDYRDESGWIYVVFPVLELRDLLGCSTTSVKDHLKALEDAGLIRRRRRSRREASRIFLLVPKDSVTDTLRDGNPAFTGPEKLPLTTGINNRILSTTNNWRRERVYDG